MFLGSLYDPRVVARSGSNISLACGGMSQRVDQGFLKRS